MKKTYFIGLIASSFIMVLGIYLMYTENTLDEDGLIACTLYAILLFCISLFELVRLFLKDYKTTKNNKRFSNIYKNRSY
jgi:hypothetical protein